jgi:DNA repair exonuclease SbcCD ATPase subunit
MKKEIYLKKLEIVNFKGLRSTTIDFDGKETIISGDNGTGKTTIQDAFLWCLFGKDHTGRADTNFSIKTWQENHEIILHQDHEVTATLLVNGNEVTLKRCLREKWGIGKNADKLMNNFTEYYKNNVKLETKKAYDTEVSSIIPEEIFKMITSPTYFPSLPGESQKALLISMAGSVSDDEIASKNDEFIELLRKLNGTPIVQFKKEIAAKKRAINEELAGIPGRIDEVNRSMPESEDWQALDNELTAKQNKLSEIEKQIADKSNVIKAEYERKSGIQKQIGDKKIQRANLESSIRAKAADANNVGRQTINDLEYKIKSQERDKNRSEYEVKSIDSQISSLNKQIDAMRTVYRSEYSKELTYPDGSFICPTCKRPLEPEDIEEKQAEMLKNFNLEKSNKLKTIQEKGKKLNDDIQRLQKEKDNNLLQIQNDENTILSLQEQKKFQEDNLPVVQNADNLISADQRWITLGNEIAELENQLNIVQTPKDENELNVGKKIINDAIDDLKAKIAKKDQIVRANKRIQELNDQMDKANQELAELEHMECTLTAFQKAKDAELTKRINGMFQLVSFTFTSEQLNGNDKINCTMWVNNAPYADANSAGKINAGLDIINAICKNKDITAPIFIVNRETTNALIPTLSQIINLRVSNDPIIKIQNLN